MSSTEDVWDMNGFGMVVNPLAVDVVKYILLVMSPVSKRSPLVEAAQSIANPSDRPWAVTV